MSAAPVVANASPLIALAQIERPDILHDLFETILIPPAVVIETAPSVVRPSWIVERTLSSPIDSRIVSASLDLGESEAICLALECAPDYLLLDDRRGRLVANELGLPVTGTLGILRLAKRRGVINAIRPLIEALAAARFHMAPDLQRQVLRDADE